MPTILGPFFMLYAKERSVSSEDFTEIKSPFICKDETACRKKKEMIWFSLLKLRGRNTQQASCEE